MSEPVLTVAADELGALLATATEAEVLNEDHRRSLSNRFRLLGSRERIRCDAWDVERAGAAREGFVWSAPRARRAIGIGALQRATNHGVTLHTAVQEEIDELFVRDAAGYARAGSLSYWLARQRPAAVAAVATAALTWTTQVVEGLEGVELSWAPCESDAYYDVAGARVTLRGRRDIRVATPHGRAIVRVRAGRPGPHAGSGLRADLVVDALSDVEGRAATLCVGLWPDAGLALAVRGEMSQLRSGARDLVRAAAAHQRRVAA